jgi:hypothetical protein
LRINTSIYSGRFYSHFKTFLYDIFTIVNRFPFYSTRFAFFRSLEFSIWFARVAKEQNDTFSMIISIICKNKKSIHSKNWSVVSTLITAQKQCLGKCRFNTQRCLFKCENDTQFILSSVGINDKINEVSFSPLNRHF